MHLSHQLSSRVMNDPGLTSWMVSLRLMARVKGVDAGNRVQEMADVETLKLEVDIMEGLEDKSRIESHRPTRYYSTTLLSSPLFGSFVNRSIPQALA